MIIRLFFLLVSVFLLPSRAAEGADQTNKRSELLKLLHHTSELKEFRERIQDTISNVKKGSPDAPAWFWSELEREVNIEAYAQWFVGLLDRGLSEKEVHEVNAVFGDENKKSLLDDLMSSLSGKKDADFVRAVQEFRRTHDERAADAIIAFMQSPAAVKYAAVRNQAEAGRKDIAVKLLVEAQQRVKARHK